MGFAGLEGSGVDDVFEILFGLAKPSGGQVAYHDTPAHTRSPFEAIKQGLALIPSNCREQGLMMDWSVRRNTTLVILDKLISRLGIIKQGQDRQVTQDYVKQLNIATDSIDKKVVNLSGGNQQKVVVAKWLATGPKILILNDPTRWGRCGRQDRNLCAVQSTCRAGACAFVLIVRVQRDAGAV